MEFGTREPLKMPKRFRPAKDVFEPVQLANGHTGELAIFATGKVISPVNGDSFLFTGLDGVSFSK